MEKRAIALARESQRLSVECHYDAARQKLLHSRMAPFRAAQAALLAALGAVVLILVFGSLIPQAYFGVGVVLVVALAVFVAAQLFERLDDGQARRSAADFSNLADRFRQLAEVRILGKFEDVSAEFSKLMDRLDAVRSRAPLVPQWIGRDAHVPESLKVFAPLEDAAAAALPASAARPPGAAEIPSDAIAPVLSRAH